MTPVVTVVIMGAALLTLAIWIEIRERRSALGDGSYQRSGPPRS